MPVIPDEAAGGMGEVCVPLASLAQPDDQEQLQTPAAGDVVSVQVDATLTRIEGENAYLKPTAVNGKPLEAEAAVPPAGEPDGDEAEGAALRGMAGEM